MVRATLENRLKYESLNVLEEDKKSQVFRKLLENSNVRLNAIITINSTYKKMIQVLNHESIYYEPILNSLQRDIQDQTDFINHIIYIGGPAIKKIGVLTVEMRVRKRRNTTKISIYVYDFVETK